MTAQVDNPTMSITLYDFPATVPGRVISRNTFKTRLAVNKI